LRMSILNHELSGGATASGGAAAVEAQGAPDFSSMSEEEQIAYAIQMSIQDS
ncbi:unnamed protein product, partial [Allacma fusca]